MTDKMNKTENLLEQILTELKTMNNRSQSAIDENKQQKATADAMLNNLMAMMPDQMKNVFKGGQ